MVSVGSIQSIKSTNNPITFKGHKIASDSYNEKIYKFYLPKGTAQNAQLVLKKFYRDRFNELKEDNTAKEVYIDFPANKNVVEINPDDYDIYDDTVLGYRFVIDGQDYNDTHRNLIFNNKKYNIADKISGSVLGLPMSIYHVMPNTINPKISDPNLSLKNANGEVVSYDKRTLRTNHFTQNDATLNGLISQLDRIKSLGFRKILSTPIFGQDNLTAAGYWPNNPFQITRKLGTMQDYEKFQIELFKRSMGYIADGAFTDEGLTGIHFTDVLKHGENSHFKNWFDISEFPIKLGLLPDNPLAYKNFEIKVINSPINWDVNADGTPSSTFGTRNENYDSNKETYIQLFDKRLTSENQLKSDECFSEYKIKKTNDKYEITKWTDSVLPYSFSVNPAEVVEKARIVKHNSKKQAKEYLLNWENFELTNAKNSNGVQLLTGNKNLAKLRLTLPSSLAIALKTQGYTNYEIESIINKKEEAVSDARNYIFSVGSFWTNKTAKILRKYIAKQFKTANAPDDFIKIIKTNIQKGLLPTSLGKLTTDDINIALSNDYNDTNVATLPVDIPDILKEYPPEALEVGKSVTSIFANPTFKTMANKKLYEGVMSKIVHDIISRYENKFDTSVYDYENREIKTSAAGTLQLMGDEIARYLLIKSLLPNADLDDISENNNEILRKLSDVTAKSLGISSNNSNEECSQLISLMSKNLRNISEEDINNFVERLEKYKNIREPQLRVANYIINKTEAGLSWRYDAAKDIADIESFNENQSISKETWGEVKNFWTEFNDNVNFYNPHAYKILEITDSVLSYSNKASGLRNQGELETNIIENSNSTTQSNYSYLYDLYNRFYSGATEKDAAPNTNAIDIIMNKFIQGWQGTPGYLYSGNKNNIVFSHAAVGNHDKQRIAHNFSMNTSLIYRYLDIRYNKDCKGEVDEILRDLNSSNVQFLFFPKHNSLKDMPQITRDNLDDLIEKYTPQNIAKMAALSDAFYSALKMQNFSSNDIDNCMKKITIAMTSLCRKDIDNEDLFFINTFEDNFDDILVKLKHIDSNVAQKIAPLRDNIHVEMLRPAIGRIRELSKLMVALPGNPAFYAGDELLELGGETKAKNIYLQNRNRLHHEYLTNNNYNVIKNLQDDLTKIFNLRNDEGLTSLVDGDTCLLKCQGDSGYGRNVVGLYRYNENDDAIILLHNSGFNNARNDAGVQPVSISHIDLSEGEMGAKYTEHVGLPNSLKPAVGTRYVNALNQNETYVVNSSGHIVPESHNLIELSSSVTILKRIL